VISVLVVNQNRRELLERCLVSVVAALPVGAELIVIDNGSSDGSAQMVAERFPQAELVALIANEGFAPAVVRGTGLARGDWLVLVNNDALVQPDCLALLSAAGDSAPDVGAVTAQVRFADRPDTLNTAGLEIDNLAISYDRLAGMPTTAINESEPVEVFGASGCVAAYRTAMLADIGGFEASFFAYMEDADVAWRARMRGWRALFEPRAVAYHHGSLTLGNTSDAKYRLVGRNRVRLIARNATGGQLLRWGWAMLLYDLAYVTFVALTDHTLAPLRGRLTGLAGWRADRFSGAPGREPVRLAGAGGWLAALRMRAAYRGAP
jgi:GT2 family glycosyltransferase